MRYLLSIILAATLMAAVTSCIEDGYTTDPSAQPVFSVDTLKMGTFFTEEVTPTFSFLVYNRYDKLLNISDIQLRDGGTGVFRLNVDGTSGREFSNIDIRPNDSIYVFVEATIPNNGHDLAEEFVDLLDFTVNGKRSTVVLQAFGQDINRRHGVHIVSDERWAAGRPYQIFDSLVVAPGARLTLDPGVKLMFHDKAWVRIDGTLVANGTPDQPVEMSGDRTDNVVGSIPFDLMASQWGGIRFTTPSRDNRLSHTVIRNTSYGVILDSIPSRADGVPALYMLNCRLRNSAQYAFASLNADVTAVGCEIADASSGVMFIAGGNLEFNHCTFANYYLFTAVGGPAVQFYHFSPETDLGNGMPLMSADFSNCIFYGIGSDVSCGDFSGTNVYLRNCLFKSEGTDDENFISSVWGLDPLYYTVREDYIFDYRLQPESPAIGAANPALTRPDAAYDYYGLPRGERPDIGAYVFNPDR